MSFDIKIKILNICCGCHCTFIIENYCISKLNDSVYKIYHQNLRSFYMNIDILILSTIHKSYENNNPKQTFDNF